MQSVIDVITNPRVHEYKRALAEGQLGLEGIWLTATHVVDDTNSELTYAYAAMPGDIVIEVDGDIHPGAWVVFHVPGVCADKELLNRVAYRYCAVYSSLALMPTLNEAQREEAACIAITAFYEKPDTSSSL